MGGRKYLRGSPTKNTIEGQEIGLAPSLVVFFGVGSGAFEYRSNSNNHLENWINSELKRGIDKFAYRRGHPIQYWG